MRNASIILLLSHLIFCASCIRSTRPSGVRYSLEDNDLHGGLVWVDSLGVIRLRQNWENGRLVSFENSHDENGKLFHQLNHQEFGSQTVTGDIGYTPQYPDELCAIYSKYVNVVLKGDLVVGDTTVFEVLNAPNLWLTVSTPKHHMTRIKHHYVVIPQSSEDSVKIELSILSEGRRNYKLKTFVFSAKNTAI